MTSIRQEEIRQMVIDALNSMGSRFFYVQITLPLAEEAEYAARLWPRSSRVKNEPGNFVVGFRP